MLLQLQVLLQALKDILSYELDLPLDGLDPGDEAHDIYEEALVLIARYPRLISRWKTKDKQEWLKELQHVGEDLGFKTRRHLSSRRRPWEQYSYGAGLA
jgi:hypothetical protein